MNYRKDQSFPVRFRPFGGMLDQFFSNIDPLQGRDGFNPAAPRVNITENGETFKLEMEAPGYAKEDLKLNLEKDVLTISAEKEHEELKENERYTRREFSQSAFSRSFRLPETVDATKIGAGYENGVLTVSLPKKEEVKQAPRQISIG